MNVEMICIKTGIFNQAKSLIYKTFNYGFKSGF